jgi:undecaprenyl-diphosphatase
LVCLALFLSLTLAVLYGQTEAWDSQVMLELARERRPWLTVVMQALSIAGSGLVEFPVALGLVLALAVRGRKDKARWYAAAALSGWALYALAKLVVRRHRPHIISHLMHGAGWYSYPSGHTMLAPLVFGLGAIAWTAEWSSPRTRRLTLLLAGLGCIAIGVSRTYLGLHYPTDVVGGLLLGTAWSGLWLLGWEPRRREV